MLIIKNKKNIKQFLECEYWHFGWKAYQYEIKCSNFLNETLDKIIKHIDKKVSFFGFINIKSIIIMLIDSKLFDFESDSDRLRNQCHNRNIDLIIKKILLL